MKTIHHKERKQLFEEAQKKKMDIFSKKATDYAKDNDIHANFKVVAGVCQALKKYEYEVDITTPEGVAMFFIVHKFIRIINLWQNGKAENEPLEDSHLDLELYSHIAMEIVKEKENGKGE